MEASAIKWGQEFYTVPIRSLNVSSRRRLEMFLNIPSNVPNSQNMPADWTGLAELMEFEYLEIQNFERERSPTLGVLAAYSNKEGSNVGALLDMIKKLEREDVITDCFVNIERDVTTFLNRLKPCQDPDVSTSVMSNAAVVQDTEHGSLQPFHAFVSSCPDDFEFVKKLIEELEVNHGLSLCIPERDLLGGTARYVVTAELIEKRCWRTILVLSPSYLQSVECDFEIKFTQALNPGSQGKKIVPVMCNRCQVPSILRFITVLDHTKGSAQAEPKWFWKRLAASLLLPPDWTEADNAYANLRAPLVYPVRDSDSEPTPSSSSSSSYTTSSSSSSGISTTTPSANTAPSSSNVHTSSSSSSDQMTLPQLAQNAAEMLDDVTPVSTL